MEYYSINDVGVTTLNTPTGHIAVFNKDGHQSAQAEAVPVAGVIPSAPGAVHPIDYSTDPPPYETPPKL